MATPDLACSQCGSPFPSDPVAAEDWRNGPLFRAGERDPALLLCPECVADEPGREFEEGAGG